MGAVQRVVGQAPADAQWPVRVLHQQPARPAQGHHRSFSWYRPRAACLRDHRTGNHLAHHRGPTGRIAGVSRRGGRGHQIQGAAQGNGESALGYARESDPRRGHPQRTRAADGAPRSAGHRRSSVPRIQHGTDPQAAAFVALAAQRGAGRAGTSGAGRQSGGQ